MDMKHVLLLLIACLLISAAQAVRRDRRQYGGYGNAQQYANQYGVYGPGGQGWSNNHRNPNQQNYDWNNNFNWNQGNRRPEWYYNAGALVKPSLLWTVTLSIVVFSRCRRLQC